MTDEPPAQPHRLAGQRLDARVRRAGRASQRALHRAGRAVPVDRPRLGGPDGRADRRHPVRRPPRRPPCRWSPRRSTGQHGVFLGATIARETTAAAAGDGRRAAPRPVRDAAVLRLQHGRLLRALARASARDGARKLPRDLLRQLVPQGRRRQVPLAGLRREQPRAEVGLRAAATASAGGRRRHRPACRRRRRSTPTASTSPPRTSRELLTVDAEQWRAQLAQLQAHFEEFGDRLPSRLADELRELGERLGRSSARKTPASASNGPQRLLDAVDAAATAWLGSRPKSVRSQR